MNAISLTAQLSERLRYSPNAVSEEEILHALERLAALEDAIDDAGLTYDPDAPVISFDKQIDDAIAKECPNYAEYKRFFEDCFERLDGHYPCAEVTSDYDIGVIFEAIERGEAARVESEA